jgi:hypothetical protein
MVGCSVASRTVYVCDWCEAESRDGGNYGPEPVGWDERGGELLCTECLSARMDALKMAKAQRISTKKPVDINKVSVRDEWKGKDPKDNGWDGDCG